MHFTSISMHDILFVCLRTMSMYVCFFFFLLLLLYFFSSSPAAGGAAWGFFFGSIVQEKMIEDRAFAVLSRCGHYLSLFES